MNKSLNFNIRFERFQKKLQHFKYAKENYLFAFKSDPLANLLIAKFRFSPIKGIFFGIILTLSVYIIGYIYSAAVGQQLIGITHTYIDIIYDIIIVPATFSFYIWISTAPSYVLFKINQNYDDSNKEIISPKLLSRFNNKLNSKIIYIAATIVSVLLAVNCIFIISVRSNNIIAHTINPYFFYFVKVPILWFISWYMVAVIGIKIFVKVFILHKILSGRYFKIDPGYPNKFGVIKPIRDFLLHFTYYLGACGYALVILYIRGINYGYFHYQWIIYAATVIYLFVAFFCFFFPLHPIYKLIKKFKEESIKKFGVGKIPQLPQVLTSQTLRNFLLASCVPPILLIILSII